eukprot:g3757.t1
MVSSPASHTGGTDKDARSTVDHAQVLRNAPTAAPHWDRAEREDMGDAAPHSTFLYTPWKSKEPPACQQQYLRIVKRGNGAIRELSATALGNMMWGCGQTNTGNTLLYQEILRQSLAKLASFSSEGVAKLIWGMVTLRYYNEDLLENIRTYYEQRMGEFDADSAAVLLWSLSKTKESDTLLDLMRRSLTSLAEKIERLSGCGCTKLWELLGGLQLFDEGFLTRLGAHTDHCLITLLPEELGNILWSCSALRFKPVCFGAMSTKAFRILKAVEIAGSGKPLAEQVSSAADGSMPQVPEDELSKAVPKDIPAFLYTVVQAFSILSMNDRMGQAATLRLARCAGSVVSDLTHMQVVNLALSFCALQIFERAFFEPAWPVIEQNRNMNIREIKMLFTVDIILSHSNTSLRGTPTFQQWLKETIQDGGGQGIKQKTSCEDEMSVLLEELGEKHSRTIHNINIALVEKKIALVCFPESSYLAGGGESRVGQSAAQSTFLQCMGWRVIPVRLARFTRLATLKKKKEFLRESIAELDEA